RDRNGLERSELAAFGVSTLNLISGLGLIPGLVLAAVVPAFATATVVVSAVVASAIISSAIIAALVAGKGYAAQHECQDQPRKFTAHPHRNFLLKIFKAGRIMLLIIFLDRQTIHRAAMSDKLVLL